ncbi:MAG: undecaprenyl-phosphate glucose phosphotransferase [Eubacteriales bacterium]
MQRNKDIILTLSAIGDFMLNLLSVYITFELVYKRFGGDLGKKSLLIVAIAVLGASIIYFIANVYSSERYEKLSHSVFRIAVAQMIAMTVIVGGIAIFSPEKKYYLWAISACAVSFVFICAKKIVTIKMLHYIRMKNKNPKDVLIVGNGYGAEEYAKQINDNLHFGYNIIGCVSDVKKPRFKKLGGYKDLDAVIKKYRPREVILALSVREEPKTQEIVSVCDKNGVRASIIPAMYRYFRSKCQVDMIGNLPIINTRAIPLDNLGNAAMKRALDILISLILIIITLPIMAVAFVGVRLSSKGPVIFKQKRVGKNNKEFTMYKFRSMVVNSEQDTAWTTNNDPRKTKFGTFMRKTGIDELPQLFNVLFGQMSIVGPRPELAKYVEEYSKTIPLYMVKHQVKPGITGLAQIYGYRGDTSIERRIELDIKYIENWTLWSDIKILLLTPFKMFNRNEKYVK